MLRDLHRYLAPLGVVCVVLDCSVARGQEGRPVALDQGQPAAFSGLLLEHRHAAELLKAEPQRDRARAEVRGLKARLLRTEADLAAERQGRQVDRDEASARDRAHADALERLEALCRDLVEPPAWYERPAFVATTAVVATLLVGGVVVYLVR